MIRLAILCFCSGVTYLALPANAQSFCADRASVVVKLNEAYGERFVGGGLEGDAYVFEVWASDESGTWTILRTDAHGTM